MEWKGLTYDNLPHDILANKYEFEYYKNGIWNKSRFGNEWAVIGLLKVLLDNPYKYRYKKRS